MAQFAVSWKEQESELGPVIRKDVLLYSSTRNTHICQGQPAVCDSGCMSERKIQVLTVNFCVIGQLWWKSGYRCCLTVLGSNPPSVWSLHVPRVSVWVLSRHSDFLPHSKDLQLIGDPELLIGVNVSAHDCLSLCVSPATDSTLRLNKKLKQKTKTPKQHISIFGRVLTKGDWFESAEQKSGLILQIADNSYILLSYSLIVDLSVFIISFI